ncbi:MAG: sigma factor, partial [Glaciecola sp.]
MEHEELLLLLKRVAAGNQPAFNKLYKLTSGQLFAIALKMLKNRDSAEEALQEAYVSIWYKADYYKEGQGT